MDALRNANRNGLDGDFFNFVPLVPVIAPALGARAIVNKKKATKFKNQKAIDLSIKYPHKLTSEEQDQNIAMVSREQRNIVEEKNKSKGSKRAKLNAELKGYDEYLEDLRKVRDELLANEKKAYDELMKAKQEEKTKVVEEPKLTGEAGLRLNNDPLEPKPSSPQPQKEGKSNTLVFVGLGAIVLIGIVFLMRKK